MRSEHTERLPHSVVAFVSLLVIGAVALFLAVLDDATPGTGHWAPLIGLCALLVAAERLDVRFRLHGQVESLNLTEAIVAPLVFAFSAPVVMAAITLSQLTSGVLRRNDTIKSIFNAFQWAVAAGLADISYDVLKTSEGVTVANMAAMLTALAVAGCANQFALTTVLRLAQRRSIANVLHNLSPVIVPGWLVGWALNTLVGLLFVLAYASNTYAVVLFWVPLLVLHAAYRGYAGMESDRMRLAGLHRASHRLASKGDLDRALAGFLAEMCRCFEAERAELWLIRGEDIDVYRGCGARESNYERETDETGLGSNRFKVAALRETTRLGARDEGELGQALREAGIRDALVTPLPGGDVPGMLVVFDQNGLEGFEEGEYAVLEALARETTSSFEKGRLSAAVVQERHRLSQIVQSTYDGVLTLTSAGLVRTWNPGWEQITGYSAYAVVGRRLSDTVDLFDLEGHEVRLDVWPGNIEKLPRQIQVLDRAGNAHYLECAYRTENGNGDGEAVLAVVAHDASDSREVEQLREDVERISEMERVQRSKVLQLQESLQPDVPDVPEAEFGVYYQPSDTTAPTGGDFYDWQVLPGGDIHIAVVDVLGHGIEATNDAIAMIHLLRTLAMQGTPVERLVATADDLITTFNPELVATVMCGRYRPTTGTCRLAGGGHPPALLVRPTGNVDEIAVPGVPVGWPGAGSDRAIDVTLSPQDTLILYTDGLVEAQRDILLGLEMLSRNASQTRDMPAPALAQALVERSLEGAARRDDSLALVVRHVGTRSSATDGPVGFGVRSRPSAAEVSTVRHRFLPWANDQHLTDEQVDDLAMAVTELSSNAARVADSFFEVRAAVVGHDVVVEVEDDGPGFATEEVITGTPDADLEHGRGLFIVRSLVDDLTIRSTGRGCVVRVVVAADIATGEPLDDPGVHTSDHPEGNRT